MMFVCVGLCDACLCDVYELIWNHKNTMSKQIKHNTNWILSENGFNQAVCALRYVEGGMVTRCVE